jgi:flagellar P-ring protein FlgI
MEAEIRTEFINQDKITLILETSQSSFGMAQDIEDLINQFTSSGFDGNGSRSSQPGSSSSSSSNTREKSASAIDQLHVEVKIPQIYKEHPVQFISELLKLRLVVGKNNRRVVIREREGVVAIGEDVMIAPVAISHKNLTISSKNTSTGGNGFIPVGYDRTSTGSENSSLKQLVSALNLLAVPNEDIIAIIKTIERQGNLYGELVIE